MQQRFLLHVIKCGLCFSCIHANYTGNALAVKHLRFRVAQLGRVFFQLVVTALLYQPNVGSMSIKGSGSE